MNFISDSSTKNQETRSGYFPKQMELKNKFDKIGILISPGHTYYTLLLGTFGHQIGTRC